VGDSRCVWASALFSGRTSRASGEIGPDLFRAACRMGLEGFVPKRRDRPYQAGRSKHWVKVKNPESPAAAGRYRDEEVGNS
jgi:ATP-dependent DNA ligase